MILDTWDLIQELRPYNLGYIIPPRDNKVFCPTPEWCIEHMEFVYKQLPPEFSTDPKKLGEGFDCEDAAIRVMDRATDALLLNKSLKGKCGHSVGMSHYHISNFNDVIFMHGIKGSHLSNLVRCSDGVWYAMEIQRKKLYDFLAAVRTGSVTRVEFCWL